MMIPSAKFSNPSSEKLCVWDLITVPFGKKGHYKMDNGGHNFRAFFIILKILPAL